MASINQTQARVEFHDSGVSSTSDGLNVKVLEERLKECIYLQQQLSQANRHLALDTRYIQKVCERVSTISITTHYDVLLGIERGQAKPSKVNSKPPCLQC